MNSLAAMTTNVKGMYRSIEFSQYRLGGYVHHGVGGAEPLLRGAPLFALLLYGRLRRKYCGWLTAASSVVQVQDTPEDYPSPSESRLSDADGCKTYPPR